MTATDLTEKTATLLREQYRGAESVAAYTDTASEFRDLISTAGVSELTWRPKLRVTGKDRVRWLNGMITNNVRDLRAGQGIYNFVLTAQGRVLADLYLYNRDDFLVIDTDRFQVENLLTILRRYIIMDKVEIAPDDSLTSVAVTGPEARALLKKIGVTFPELKPLQLVDVTWRDLPFTLVRNDLPGVESYELWLNRDHCSDVWGELITAGGTQVGSRAMELLRIACGVPGYGQDIRERDLPQETEQERALNFTKGCYIGQEIVERIRARGAVHRKFTGFKIDGPLPAPGTKAQSGGKDVAEITSAAVLPTASGEFGAALGYVRREAHPPGAQIDIGDAKATVVDVPFAEVFASAQKA